MRVCIKKETGGPLPTHAHDDAQPLPLLGVPVAGDEARRRQAVHLCVTADGCDMPAIYIYISVYLYIYISIDIDVDIDIDIDIHMPSTFE
jgi:hypothetical protein